MTTPEHGFEPTIFTQEQLQASLNDTEEVLARDGISWDEFIASAGQSLYERGMGSFFFGLGDPLDKQLQDHAFDASVALGKLKQEAAEAGRWSGGHKLSALELLLKFSDLADHHDLESPTARHELHRQVVVDGFAGIVDKAVNDPKKEE